MTDLATPVRKDAARNRVRLLETAGEMFSTQGMEVTLKDVAREAGVGVGTVYRHFPTKDDLVDALFAEHLDHEVARARTMAEEENAWAGLVRYLEETMQAQANNCGLRALMCPQGSVVPAVRNCKTFIDPYVAKMVDTAHRQGTLREDCSAEDIAYLQVALVGIMDASPVSEPDRYRRHLELFLNGVHA